MKKKNPKLFDLYIRKNKYKHCSSHNNEPAETADYHHHYGSPKGIRQYKTHTLARVFQLKKISKQTNKETPNHPRIRLLLFIESQGSSDFLITNRRKKLKMPHLSDGSSLSLLLCNNIHRQPVLYVFSLSGLLPWKVN